MNLNLLKEFRPALGFLAKFLAIYFLANIVYGLLITWSNPQPDLVTRWVTDQAALVLRVCGWPSVAVNHVTTPTTSIVYKGSAIVSVFEGCNGINVAIIFVAFLLAFGPVGKRMSWFLPMGLLVIHVSNILRIVLLFLVTVYLPGYVYITHKYFFTASIYATIFVMWIAWVRTYLVKPK